MNIPLQEKEPRDLRSAALPGSLSIIVPVWREARIIRPFLHHLRARAPGAEIIVVDGGSDDGTAALAEGWADKILSVPRGRAQQMNLGAAASSADVFWFLHADSRVAANAAALIAEALQDPRVVGGCFRLRFPRRGWIYRVSDSFRFAFGDHGFFCRRDAFKRVGGYPELPLMEDAEFYRALRCIGRMRQLPCEIETSPRRYEKHGPYRTTAVYIFLLALYVTGAPISFLTEIHNRFVARRRNPKRRTQQTFHEQSSQA